MKRIKIGPMLFAILFLVAGCSTQQSGNTEKTKTERTENKTENTIKREKAPAETFTGTVERFMDAE